MSDNSQNSTDAEERLRSALREYLLWDKVKPLMKRVQIISGDLGAPSLGLSSETFSELCHKISAIYHNGALVNTVMPYSMLRAPNVEGTQEVLRIACTHHVKPIYFVSTLSVLSPSGGSKITEDAKPNKSHLDFMGGYGASKSAAELLLHNAHALGVPVVFFRPGTVSGHMVSGASNTSQFVNRYLQGIVQLGAAPDLNSMFDMIPVEFVAKAICTLGTPSHFGKAYHLFNVDRALTINQITSYVQSFGYPVAVVPFTVWRNMLKENVAQGDKNELAPLLSYFNVSFPTSEGKYSDAKTTAELEKAGLKCPQITETVIHHYLAYFASRGLINNPTKPGQQD